MHVKNAEEIKEIEDQLEDLKNICLLNEKTIQQQEIHNRMIAEKIKAKTHLLG